MLISLLGLAAMTVSAVVRTTLAEAPIILEGPSTLELAVIGGGMVGVWALASRRIRRPQAGVESTSFASRLDPVERTTPKEEPSRGAA